MSIRLPDAERIAAAAKHGIMLDPVGQLDTATIIVGSAFFGLSALMIAYAWCNHRYQPIRAKNLPQLTLMFFCGVMWFVGDIGANGHVSMVGPWAHCKFWRLWIQLISMFLFSCCVLVRVCALYWIFVRRTQFRGWKLITPFIATLAGAIVFCIVGQLASPKVTVDYNPEYQLCTHNIIYQSWGSVFQSLLWCAIVVFMCLVRNIQPAFNEVHESLVIVFITLFSLLQNVILGSVRNPIAAHIRGRNATTWIDFICANLTIWVIVFVPVYQSIFNRKTYLARWRARLINGGLLQEYNVVGNADTCGAIQSSLSTLPNASTKVAHNSAWKYQDMNNSMPIQRDNSLTMQQCSVYSAPMQMPRVRSPVNPEWCT